MHGGALQGGAQVGAEPAAVAEAGERVRHRLLAHGLVGEDLRGGLAGLPDQLRQQVELGRVEGPAVADDLQGAGHRLGIDSDGHRQRGGRVGGIAAEAPFGSGLQPDRCGQPVEVEAAGCGVDGIDRAVQEDVE